MGYDGPLDGHLTGVSTAGSATPIELAGDGDSAVFDITPAEHRISLDDVVETDSVPRQHSLLSVIPPGAAAIASLAVGLVALLGAGVAATAQERIDITRGVGDGPHALRVFLPTVNIQLALGAAALALGVLAVVVARRTAETRRWVRDVAVAAIVIAVIGLALHGYAWHALDTTTVPQLTPSIG